MPRTGTSGTRLPPLWPPPSLPNSRNPLVFVAAEGIRCRFSTLSELSRTEHWEFHTLDATRPPAEISREDVPPVAPRLQALGKPLLRYGINHIGDVFVSVLFQPPSDLLGTRHILRP
jgi:hypothetical protein